MAAPRQGHLDQVFHIFAYLKKYGQSKFVFDWTQPDLSNVEFKDCDWKLTYPDAKEPLPVNAPAPRGKSVSTTCYVDADHAGCKLTCRSHTGILIFVNKAPILFYSKRQNCVESCTFGSECVAMWQAVDMIEALRYKIRMFGVPLDGPTSIFGDNEVVVKSTTTPESTLKKKHVSVAWHHVREAQAGKPKWIQIGKVDTGKTWLIYSPKSLLVNSGSNSWVTFSIEYDLGLWYIFQAHEDCLNWLV